MSDELYALATGSYHTAQFYPSCEVNGVKFITCHRNDRLTTQNSGVCVPTDEFNFYGQMEDVIVLNYRYDCRVVLFKCNWFGDKHDAKNRVRKDRIFGTTSVYVAKKWFTDEPFILATQAKQVFYLNDLHNGREWKIVEDCNHRFLWDLPDIDGPSSSTISLLVQSSDFDALSFHRPTSHPEPVHDDNVEEQDNFIDDEEDEIVHDVGNEEELVDEDIDFDDDE